jgi:hypothetical protein
MDDAEFIYYTDPDGCINSGGFCIKSIMLKNKISPIITMNKPFNGQQQINKVSDIFDDLVVPNWAYLQQRSVINSTDYNDNFNYNPNEHIKCKISYENDNDEVVDDYLYNQLLELAKEENMLKKQKKNESRKKKLFKTTTLRNKNLKLQLKL